MSSFSIENIAGQVNTIDVKNLTVNTSTVTGNLIGVPGGTFNGTTNTQLSSLAAGAVLVSGTRYISGTITGGVTFALPSQATSKRGDRIEVIYTVLQANGTNSRFGTAGESFAPSSSLIKPRGVGFQTAFPTTEAILDIIGLTNAGSGVGSTITFVFLGSQWQVDARITTSGTGAGINPSVFV